ncbi:hypothetical protein [Sinomonas sp. G460-2]|uniref:hypothetical protein n=1 Tax=Sinomonas sp. G460-2 TaxID=3393464 RepID=UPI0039EEDFD3
MTEPLFLEVGDDPASLGLPVDEIGNFVIAMTVPDLAVPRLSVVVDRATAGMVAYTALQGYATAPLNLSAVRWLRSGWPDDWPKLDEPAEWLRPPGETQGP